MGFMWHRPCKGTGEQKVFLATPSYSGVEAGFALALFESCKALMAAGIDAELALFANDCHVDDSRNRLVRQFLMTDCTDLVFLDADLHWHANDLVKLCRFDVDVVGSTYPLKQDAEAYPVRPIGDGPDGLLEAEGLPTGFLRIRRHVLETMADKAEKYLYKSDNGIPSPLIFERSLEGMTRWGGDYTFCRKWRALGGRLYLYPDPCFGHIGNQLWEGSYKHFLERSSKGAIHAGLDAIRDGRETSETLKRLVNEWDNEWSGDVDLLAASVLLSRGKKVLECGSGLSTLCMLAGGATVHSLEHSPDFAERIQSAAAQYLTPAEVERFSLEVSPLVDGWYSSCESGDVDLLLCDGPPRAMSDRNKVVSVLDRLKGPILMDDFTANPLPFTWRKLTERVSVGYRTASH